MVTIEPRFKPLHRIAAPVREQLIESFRVAITSGELRPGERLIERELCEETGASRTSVREALRHLEGEGLVTLLPQRGAVVTAVSHAEAAHIYELREVLEGEAARLFAERASDIDVADLRGAHLRLDAAYAVADVDSIVATKRAFYDAIYTGCGNPLIGSTLVSLSAPVAFLQRTTLSSPGRAPAARIEFAEAVEALEARDGSRAQRAFAAHVRNASAVALAALEETGQ